MLNYGVEFAKLNGLSEIFIPDIEAEALKAAAEKLSAKLGQSAVVLGFFTEDSKVTLVASFSKEAIAKAYKLVNL